MRTRARLLGLLATVILLGILLGLPATLLALGANPIPDSLPTFDQIRSALTSPDDGTLVLNLITVIAWAAWAVLAGSILLEIGARLRGLRAPRLPGLAIPQGAATQLVAAALLLFTVTPTAPGITPAAAAAPANTPARSSIATLPTSAPTKATGPAHGRYTVRRGDTLSGIAQRELGDADRWPEIAHLNPPIDRHPDLIQPGTILTLPAAATRSYLVQAGDTLSGIAERELGDAADYPRIFDASRRTRQPGGVHLSDPDRIDIGQTLTIPGDPIPSPSRPPIRPQRPGPSATGTSSPAPGRPSSTPRRNPEPATPIPAPTIPSGATQRTPGAIEVTATGQEAPPAPWMLAGLTGAGALLAGAMLTLLRRRRRAQLRHRRPGRTLASPAPVLQPVEKTLTAIGSRTGPTVEHLDTTLRRLAAATAASGGPMPALAAVELTATHLVLHLSEPADPSPPWEASDDRCRWQVTPDTPADQIGPDVPDQPAPYPLLVTIGLGDHDEVWLLNIEDRNLVITGDPTYGQDFARYLAADVACNPWSAGVDVACVGVASELAALNPDRIHAIEPTGEAADPIGQFLADAVATVDRTGELGTDVTTARARQAGADPWPARLLLIDAAVDTAALTQLLELVHTHPGTSATSVVVAGSRTHTSGTILEVNATGRLTLAEAGLDLVAVGLTIDEALGCASLLGHSETVVDVPVPTDDDTSEGWRTLTDNAGALRPEHTLPRHDDTAESGDQPSTASLLDATDDTYLTAGATTVEDLQHLAPRVAAGVRQQVEDADPTLDDDLAMWFHPDCALPRLRLLGPVRATTRGKPLTKRKPYMTELLAFIALRRLGATPEEVADAFNITKAKARDYVLTIRQWLGVNPRTGTYHLPDARLAPAAAVRDVPVYQVIDLLIDADLFRRLRLRGEARGGPEGINDLRRALTLVDGRPFDYPIEREHGGGWTWLIDGDRLDEHLAVAVVDVAHVVTTHALAAGDLLLARMAAETAAAAAPYEEIPRLDLAAVAAAEGHHAEAQQIIRDDVCNRTDDDGAPPELADRTAQILRARQGWVDGKAS